MIPELSTYVHHSIPVMATKHYKNEVGGHCSISKCLSENKKQQQQQ